MWTRQPPLICREVRIYIANTRRWPNVGLMLAHRFRRSIGPTTRVAGKALKLLSRDYFGLHGGCFVFSTLNWEGAHTP